MATKHPKESKPVSGWPEPTEHVLYPWALVLAKLSGGQSWHRRTKQKVWQMFQCQNISILLHWHILLRIPAIKRTAKFSADIHTEKPKQIRSLLNPISAMSLRPNSKIFGLNTYKIQILAVEGRLNHSSQGCQKSLGICFQIAATEKKKKKARIWFFQGYLEAWVTAPLGWRLGKSCGSGAQLLLTLSCWIYKSGWSQIRIVTWAVWRN